MSEFSNEQKEFLHQLFGQLNSRLEQQSVELKEEIKQQIGDIKVEVQSALRSCEEKIIDLEKKNNILQQKVNDLDRKIRKNNLVIYGVEKEGNLKLTILKLVKDILDIEVCEKDIKDIYLLGDKNKKETPVLIEFMSHQKKMQILKNSFKFKEQGISVADDLSKEDRANRKILLKHRFEARQKGLQAYIQGDKLKVSNELYTIAELENLVEKHIPGEIPSSNSAPSTPNPQGRQKRLIEEFKLGDENDIQPQPKKNKPLNQNNNILTNRTRVLRSSSAVTDDE